MTFLEHSFYHACTAEEEVPCLQPLGWAELICREYRNLLKVAEELGYDDEDHAATLEALSLVEKMHAGLREAIQLSEAERVTEVE